MDRKYKCSYCPKDFAHPTTCQRHERIHTGEKPYKCSFCDKQFIRPTDKKRHELLHTGEKPHECSQCKQRFSRPYLLTQHKYYHHTTEGEQKRKQQEMVLERFFNSKNINFEREHPVTFECIGGTSAKIDFIMDPAGRIIFTECDEFQHKTYGVSCEVRRMTEVQSSLMLGGNTLPIVWIRYNPNAFKVDGVGQPVPREERLNKLLDKINEISAMTDLPPMSVHYLFYDMVGGKPAIFNDPEYAETFKELVCL